MIRIAVFFSVVSSLLAAICPTLLTNSGYVIYSTYFGNNCTDTEEIANSAGIYYSLTKISLNY